MSDRQRKAQSNNDNYGDYGATDRDRDVRVVPTPGRDREERGDRGRRSGGGCCEGGCCCCRVRDEAYDPNLRESRHARARARMEARLDADERYGRYGNPDYEGQFRRRPSRNDRIADPDYIYRERQQREPYQRSGNWQDRLGPGYLAPEDRAYGRYAQARYTQDDLAYDMNPRAYREGRGGYYNNGVGVHFGGGRHGGRPDIDLRFGNGQFGIHVGVGDGRNRVDFDYGNGRGRYGRGNYPYDYDYGRGNYPYDYDSDYGRRRRGGYDDGYGGYDDYRNRNRQPWDERYPGDDWMYGGNRNRNRRRNPNDDYYYGRNDDYYGRRRYPDDYYGRNDDYYGRRRYPDDYYGRNDDYYGRRRYPNDDYYSTDDYYRRNPNRRPWDERYPGDDWMYGNTGAWGGRRNYPYDYGRNQGRYGQRDGVYFGIGPDGRFYGGFQKDGIGIDVGSGGNRRYYGQNDGYYDQYGRRIDPRIARHGGYYDQQNRYLEDYYRQQRYPTYGRNNFPNGDYGQYDSRYGRRHSGLDLGIGLSVENGRLYTNFGGIRARILQ